MYALVAKIKDPELAYLFFIQVLKFSTFKTFSLTDQ